MFRGFYAVTLLIAVLLVAGCSGGLSPLFPDSSSPALQIGQTRTSELAGGPVKSLWGLWTVSIDKNTWEIEIVPQKGVEYTVDVVTFLQPPIGNPTNFKIAITDISDFVSEGKITVDVGLGHPFSGLDQFVGFDVMGVVMGSGSYTSPADPGVRYSDGDNDLILMNPDGYTRWMNPTEFSPDGTILNFVPGNLGTPDLDEISATIHGYKYYVDGLAVDEDLYSFMTMPGQADYRGMFTPGVVNHREFKLKFPIDAGKPKIVFQYAVLANWVLPDPTHSGEINVIDIPDDYPSSANAQEVFLVNVVDNSTLWFQDGQNGGNISLDIEVFDWAGLFDPGSIPYEINSITVENQGALIPGGYAEFTQADLIPTAMPGSTACSSVFTVEIFGCSPDNVAAEDVLISIRQTHGKFAPNPALPPNVDGPLTSYFRHGIPVTDIGPNDPFAVTDPNGGESVWMALDYEITWNVGESTASTVSIEFSTDDFASVIYPIVAETENDGSFIWVPVPNVETSTAKIRIFDPFGLTYDESDDYFTIGPPVWLEFQSDIAVDPETVTWNPWPQTSEYDVQYSEYSPALSQDLDGLAHCAWHAEFVFEPDPDNPDDLGYRQARDTGIRSLDGDAWDGEPFFFTWGGTAQDIHELRKDCMKIAPAANNTTFAAVQHWTIYFSVDVDHFPNNHLFYNAYCLDNRIYKNSEIVCDDDYLYMVSDGYINVGDGPGIYSQRVPTPNYEWPSSPGLMNTLTSFGEVSHSRSWAFHQDILCIAYYTTDGQIKLLKRTNKAADVWDDTNVIFDGAGYSQCMNPTICEAGNQKLYAAWTGINDETGETQILVSSRDNPVAEWSEPVIAASSESQINDLHISASAEQVLLPNGDSEYMILIGYEVDNTVYSQISPKNLWAFLPEQQVSADSDNCQDPDTLCMEQPYLYDALFAWSRDTGEQVENWDIRLRNGNFETP